MFYFLFILALSATVKCHQTGQISVVKLHYLSLPDQEPLSKKKLIKGADLLFNFKDKSFPVEFLNFQGLCSKSSLCIYSSMILQLVLIYFVRMK